MPKININHQSPFSAQKTFKKVKELLSKKEGLGPIGSNIQCNFDEEQRTGELTGQQFKAKINVVESGESSQVLIVIDIPLVMMAFKGKVKTTIEEKLNQFLS